MDYLSVLSQMLILLTIVLVGFLAHKRGLMGGDFDKRLSAFIIDVSCPALIVSSVLGDVMPCRDFILPLLAVGFVTYILLMAFAVVAPRLFVKEPANRGLYSFMLMFANVGFLGYPVVASIFGHEAVFYASLLNVPNTFFVFVFGTTFVKGGSVSLRHFDWHTLFYPGMLASYVAIFIVALNLSGCPDVIAKPISYIGQMTVPGALLVIGSSMAAISLRKAFSRLESYVLSVLRLVVIPVSILLLFRAVSRFFPIDDLIININTVVIAMPVASYGTMFCLRYGRDETLMVQGTLLTTIASVLSIPLLALLF